MSPPDPDQNAPRPAFSWESVVASDEPNDAPDGTDASALDPISLTIAPLSLDPLPPVPSAPTSAAPAVETPPVLGDMHIGLPTIGAPAEPPPAPSASTPVAASTPEAASTPVVASAPVAANPPVVGAPTLPTDGSTTAAPSVAPTPGSPPPPPPASPTTEPPAPPVIDGDTAPGLEIGGVPAAPTTGFEPTLPTTGGGYAPRPPAVPVPEVVTDLVESSGEGSTPASDALRIEPMDVPDPRSTETEPATGNTIDEILSGEVLPGEQPSFGLADTELADTELADTELSDTGLADTGTDTPTTVLPSLDSVAPALPSVGTAAPSSAATPTAASEPRLDPAARPGHESAPPTKRERKQQLKADAKQAKQAKKGKPAKLTKQKKLKKQKKRGAHASQAATTKPAKPAKQGRGGLALFFTLLVLVALIVAAIIFGRPYLFPDDWDEASRPYADAVEAVDGETIGEAVIVMRQATGTYEITMTDELLGDWEQQAPMWRSFGLIDGAIDAPVLRDTLAGWTGAYYSPSLGEVIVDDALTPTAVDGAIVEAMAAAALDQRTGWSTTIDDTLVGPPALARAQVVAESTATAAASSFGPAVSERRRDKAEFMPPVLSYRVNAPVALAEVVGDIDLTEAIAAETLAAAPAPELLAGDTLVEQRQLDRGFWYLVFASYSDAPTAYAASNALVEATLTTADRAGTLCSYATFSGTDVGGTERVGTVLQQWAANVPVEMTASYSALVDGTMQLTTCDPGAGATTGARFGTASELTRWRLVELAAVETIDPLTGTPAERTAAVNRVRQSQAATPLLGLPLDTPTAELAQLARAAAQPAG